jgi:hypothetical protein
VAKLFGRERELGRIERGLAAARAGNGSLVLLTGEPGIGKSTVGREAGARAAASGMRVVAGRCWEVGGAAAYWPWVQVFRGLGGTPFEELVRDDGGDSQQRRFQLFDAATRVLAAGAAEQPLVVFLDDLHAADLPSLLLLLFLARQLSAARLFVLGTARDVESRLSPEVGDVLAKIGREGEVASLARLTPADVAAWVTTVDRPAPSADDVFQITEGNPLFVQEVLRVGAGGGHRLTSDGMKAALDEHLRKLSPEGRALLQVAAVLGRDFGSRELAEAAGDDHDSVLERVRQGVDLGVLEATERERFQFAHVLLRDRLYEALAAARRSQLHWKVGLAAELHGTDLARAANHLLEGAGAGQVERAVACALRAAEQALARLAFEDAAQLAERALALLGPEPSALACKVEIACGEGLIRSGAPTAGRLRCARAADMAKAFGCAAEQARAALVYACEVGTVGVDPVMVRLLDEACGAIEPGDSPLRAKLEARLAAALMPPRTQESADRAVGLARAALAMARRLGDADTLAYVLEHARYGLAYMIPSDERFELIRETMTQARALDQRLTIIKIAPSYAASLLERGLRAEADAALATVVELDAAIGSPQLHWRLPMLRAGFALFDGQVDEADRLGDEGLALSEGFESNAASEWAVQRIALAIARGEPAGIAPHAARALAVLARGPWTGPIRTWILAATGRRDEAAATLRELAPATHGFPTLVVAAEACALLKDMESAAQVDEWLRKRSFGMPFFWGPAGAYVIGPTSRLFGDLALLLGRRDEARRQYEEAIALCRRIGAKPFLELSLAGLARLEGEGGAGKRAARPAAPHARDISLRRDGDVWAIEGSFGAAFRLKDSKGLSYLSELLAHPGQELHVLALIGLDHVGGDAGPVLDARAKAAYKKRLDSLQDELAEAEGFGDQGRASRARQELELLATQLAGAVGLGGRDRRAASDAERARINVQRRLKDAIESVGACNRELGRYLAAAVKTGTYCSFTPV